MTTPKNGDFLGTANTSPKKGHFFGGPLKKGCGHTDTNRLATYHAKMATTHAEALLAQPIIDKDVVDAEPLATRPDVFSWTLKTNPEYTNQVFNEVALNGRTAKEMRKSMATVDVRRSDAGKAVTLGSDGLIYGTTFQDKTRVIVFRCTLKHRWSVLAPYFSP